MEPLPPDTVPCPGCAGPMGLDEEVCPHCRRPRDEGEIERGKRELMEEAERVRRRPYVLAARAAAAAAALVLFLARGAIVRVFSGAAERVDGEVRRYSDPDFLAGRTPAAPAPPAPEAAAEEDDDSPPPPPSHTTFAAPARKARPLPIVSATPAYVPPAPPAPAPPAAPPPRPAKAAPPPPPPDAANWVFYGVVYDMVTANAIAGARVTLNHAGQDWGASTVTDENGFYRLYTPRHTGGDEFVLAATADGYREGQIEDRPNPWREATQARRRAALAELTGHDLDPIPRNAHGENQGRENVDILLIPVKP